jgi:hypothetical protein
MLAVIIIYTRRGARTRGKIYLPCGGWLQENDSRSFLTRRACICTCSAALITGGYHYICTIHLRFKKSAVKETITHTRRSAFVFCCICVSRTLGGVELSWGSCRKESGPPPPQHAAHSITRGNVIARCAQSMANLPVFRANTCKVLLPFSPH